MVPVRRSPSRDGNSAMTSAQRISLLVLLAVLLAPAGWAAPRNIADTAAGGWQAPAAVDGAAMARDRVSLDQAVAMVRRQTGGRIIKASTRRSNGRAVHHIRVLTRDGKVFTVRIDAASGRRL